MLNRRTLFGRLLLTASAFFVAPAVTVEAAPQDTPVRDQTGLYVRDGEWRMAVNGYDVGSAQRVVDQVRADAYERGRAVAEARADSRAMLVAESGGTT